MTLQDVQAVLERIAEDTPNKQPLSEVRNQLEECQSILKGETSFKRLSPGDPVPILRYEVVEARDSVENAIRAAEQNDAMTTLKHVQEAASLILRAT